MTLPTFIGIGAPRAGSTWLYQVLRSHPEIYMPHRRKEIMFFDHHFDRGLQWYQGFFPKLAEAEHYRAIGEVSPWYMVHQETAPRIQRTLNNCRLLVILRNPIDRTYSRYKNLVLEHGEKRSFSVFVREDQRAVDVSCYDRHIEYFRRFFAADRFKYIIFERATRNPVRSLATVADFLGLTHGFEQIGIRMFENPNPSQVTRFPRFYGSVRAASRFLRDHDYDFVVNIVKGWGIKRLSAGAQHFPFLDRDLRRELLVRHFAESISRTEELIQEDLSEWRQ